MKRLNFFAKENCEWISVLFRRLLRLTIKFGYFTANGSYHSIIVTRNSFQG